MRFDDPPPISLNRPMVHWRKLSSDQIQFVLINSVFPLDRQRYLEEYRILIVQRPVEYIPLRHVCEATDSFPVNWLRRMVTADLKVSLTESL